MKQLILAEYNKTLTSDYAVSRGTSQHLKVSLSIDF
jgi:hypothetical protein